MTKEKSSTDQQNLKDFDDMTLHPGDISMTQEEASSKLSLMPMAEEVKAPATVDPVPASGPDKLLSIIDRVSGSGLTSENMDQVERLFKMHQELLDREAEAAFNDALSMAQQEIESIAVNKSSDKHKYADLNAIHAAAKPIWTKHGLSVLTKMKPSTVDGCVTVYGELRHKGGHKEPFSNDWPIDAKSLQGKDLKTPIQALGSTVTYARRYTELMLFDVAIKGEDNDGASAGNDLSDAAFDWIAKVEESTTMEELQKNYQEGFKALDGDNFGKNRLNKAKDAMKAKLKGN